MISNKIFFFLVSVFMAMPISKYLFNNSNYADFGIFENSIYKITTGNSSIFLDGHFSPIFFLFSAILSFFQILSIDFFFSYFLILFQSFIILTPAIYFYFKRENLLTFVYLLCPPIWFLNFNDFHIDVLIIPIIFFSLIIYFKKPNNYRFLTIILFAALLKEYYSLILISFGFFIIFEEKKFNYFAIFLILIGLIIFFSYYLYFQDIYTITDKSKIGDSQMYSGFIGDDFLSLIKNLFLNFNHYFFGLFEFKKIIYLVFFIFYFLIFIRFKLSLLIIIFPFLLINLISLNTTFVSLINHHIVTLIPVLIYNFYIYKNKFKDFINKFNLNFFYIILFLCFSPNFFSPYFYFNDYDLFNFSNYLNYQKKVLIKQELKKTINSTKSISIQNNLNHNYLSFRENYFLFPEGVFDFKFKKDKEGNDIKILVDYVIIDLSKTSYIYDKKCVNLKSICTDYNNNDLSFHDLFTMLKNSSMFEILYTYDGFYIFKRLNTHE